MFVPLAVWLVLVACAIAATTDVRARRIPNALTGALALGALGLNAAAGLHAFLVAVALLVGVTLLGFVTFSFGWLGGGDVKLLAGSAAALGFPDALAFLLYTSLGGGLLALGVALGTGRLRDVLTSVALVLRPFVYKGTAPVAPRSAMKLPYAVAIAFGAGVVALSHGAAPFLRLAP